MSEELKHKIYSTTECISEQKMFDYIDGKLKAKEQHLIEKHLLDCDLCSDALEGLKFLKNRTRIASINQKISERIIAIPKKESKIIFFNFKTITSIAAAIALLIGSVFLFNQFATKEMKESDVAELKKESAPPPPVTISNTESAAASDSIKFKETESGKTKNKDIQFEAAEKSQQQFALTEEPKPDSYYKNPIASGEGSTARTIVVTTGDAITKSDANNEVTIPVESSIPKAGLLEKEKDIALDETKKAEEKNENQNVTSVAQTTTSPQKNDAYYSMTDKKTEKVSKNIRFQKDTKGKDRVVKESADEDVAGNVAYSPQNIIADQENLKTEKPRSETTSSSIADSVIIFRSGEPQFPGGSDSLMAFIKKNFDISRNTYSWNSAMGTKIIIEFIIDTKGNILDPKIKQGINKELNDKAIEMVKKMPNWIPVTKPYKYELPIRLELK